ncbi:hypothetical protein AB1Y20_016978 [Prymnesium parvum]|uniref:Uncharacterized protein n=1 Tax=Prymnesium parvum TaxID=97485 RepID=A0AB34IC25_PRYPA
MATDGAEASLLPAWLDSMLQPGVGPGVFRTLKVSLILLMLVICVMLYYIEDPSILFHLRIYLTMTLLLTLLVVWFIREIQQSGLTRGDDKGEGHADGKATKAE